MIKDMESGFNRMVEDVRSLAGTVEVGGPVTLIYHEWIGGRWIDVEVTVHAVGRK